MIMSNKFPLNCLSLVFVASMCASCNSFDASLCSEELEKLNNDFENCIYNDFYAYHEYERDCLHFYNGDYVFFDRCFNDYDGRSILALSKSTIFYVAYHNSNYEKCTEIRTCDYDGSNEKTLCSLEGDHYTTWLANNGHAIMTITDQEYCMKKDSDNYLDINPNTGETVRLDSFDEQDYYVYSYGTFEKDDKDYLIKLPKEEEIRFNCNKIDDQIRTLLDKWSFKAYRSHRLPFGIVACSFIRKIRAGQKAIMLLTLNSIDQSIVSYQFVPIFTSYQVDNKILCIYDSITSKITII